MRTGRRLTWLIYAVCVLLVVDGLAWVTWQMLSLERREQAAQQNARQQEAVRLALWRMDGLLSPVIAAEAARPYFHYRSFYPAERAYTRMWEELRPGEVLVPSPLLAGPGEFIRLHFESAPDGWLTSPQAPDAEFRDRAESAVLSLPDVLTVERQLNELTAILRGAPAIADERDAVASPPPEGRDAGIDRRLDGAQQDLYAYAREQREKSEPELLQLEAAGPAAVGQEAVEADRSIGEFQARQRNALQSRDFADTAARVNKAASPEGEAVGDALAPAEVTLRTDMAADKAAETDGAAVQTGRFAPVWRTNPVTDAPELLFVRAVTVGGHESTQGFWIDWPALRAALLDSIRDLLPEAELVPLVRGGVRGASAIDSAAHAGQLLAGVPAVLVPGAMDAAGVSGLTPTRTVLLVAWVAVLAAVAAIAAVLRASLVLSERRGRFVSAVTHELRTPLTTFCLYSQMLADGMVKDEGRRGEYLGTLRRESERLATIVENVLAFARVGSRGAAVSPHSVGGLLDVAGESLAESASQCGMVYELDAEGVEGVRVACDGSSLERILSNLVDNACKYAGGAEDRRVTLRVRVAGNGVEFRVRDRGPGIPRRERRRVFSPFARARVNAADGSSGLGLGLALARGVARSLGGELRLGKPAGPGAEFVLWLPAVASSSSHA